MATCWQISEYDESQCWIQYGLRLKCYFKVNDITDDDKQWAILLSVCGATCYTLIRNLVKPAKPVEKSFQQLCAAMRTHTTPTKQTVFGKQLCSHSRKVTTVLEMQTAPSRMKSTIMLSSNWIYHSVSQQLINVMSVLIMSRWRKILSKNRSRRITWTWPEKQDRTIAMIQHYCAWVMEWALCTSFNSRLETTVNAWRDYLWYYWQLWRCDRWQCTGYMQLYAQYANNTEEHQLVHIRWIVLHSSWRMLMMSLMLLTWEYLDPLQHRVACVPRQTSVGVCL